MSPTCGWPLFYAFLATISRGSVLGFFLGLTLVLLLSGCARGLTSTPGNAPNLQRWVDAVRARPSPPLAPLPVVQPFEAFVYTAHDLRDPFAHVWSDSEDGSGVRPDPNRRKQPLEAFALDSLEMVGTIGSGRGRVALVMTPDNVAYRVRRGVYLGQSDGRVIAVNEGSIDLIELVPDGVGGWLERPASIALAD